MTWSLVVTANSGPGAVGEILLDSAGYDVERQRSRSATSLLPSDEVQLLAPFELTSTSTVDLHKGLGKRPNSRNGTRKQRFRSNSNVSASSSDSEADRDDFDLMLKRLGEEGDDEEGKSIELIMPSTFNGVKLASMSRPAGDPQPQSSSSSTLTAKANGRARFCRKCKLPKPDRAHHCSTCGFCVLKMDHHCPWIGGCVGFKNYKPFILFLLYADLLALFTAGTSLWALLQTMDMDIEVRLRRVRHEVRADDVRSDSRSGARRVGLPCLVRLSFQHDVIWVLSVSSILDHQQSHHYRKYGTQWTLAIFAS